MHSLCRLCLRVGPFHIALHRNLFHKAGVDVRWTDIKAGTGALITAAKSNRTRRQSWHSPRDSSQTSSLGSTAAPHIGLRRVAAGVGDLVRAARRSGVNSVEDLKHQTIAVSRFTSGSHLMTCVLAAQRGWRQDDVKYVVKGPSVVRIRTQWRTYTGLRVSWLLLAQYHCSPSLLTCLRTACDCVQVRGVTSGCQRWHCCSIYVGTIYDGQSHCHCTLAPRWRSKVDLAQSSHRTAC